MPVELSLPGMCSSQELRVWIMFAQPAMSGESSWRHTMELESRKQVIEEWLSSPDIPLEIIEVLQEMLATTESLLQTIRSEGLEDANLSRLREAK